MTQGKLLLKAIWGDRKQTIYDASQEISSLLISLCTIDHVYKDLIFVMDKEEKNVRFKVSDFQEKSLANFLTEKFLLSNKSEIKKYHRDIIIDENFSEEIGFRFWFHTPHKPEEQFNLIFDIGHYGIGNFYKNQFLLKFPLKYRNTYAWFNTLLKIIVNQLSVYKAGVFPEFTNRLKSNPIEYPGWITYYYKSFNMPEVPGFVELEQIENQGTFYTITRDDFDIKNRIHMERLKEFYLKFLEKYPLGSI